MPSAGILSRMTTINANVKKMVVALPDFRVGDQVHAIFVNKVEGSLPGRDPGAITGWYIDIFFPGWRPATTVFLTSRLEPPYRWLAPRLLTPDDQVCGRAFLDARMLTHAEAQAEQAKAKNWTGDSRLAFADALGRQMGSIAQWVTAAVSGPQ
jgi:hypothetical protein